MNYLDTDNTETDWGEFGQHNKTERCPITGVSTALDYGPAEFSGDRPAAGDSEPGARSTPKLQAMFDKFLYQK